MAHDSKDVAAGVVYGLLWAYVLFLLLLHLHPAAFCVDLHNGRERCLATEEHQK